MTPHPARWRLRNYLRYYVGACRKFSGAQRGNVPQKGIIHSRWRLAAPGAAISSHSGSRDHHGCTFSFPSQCIAETNIPLASGRSHSESKSGFQRTGDNVWCMVVSLKLAREQRKNTPTNLKNVHKYFIQWRRARERSRSFGPLVATWNRTLVSLECLLWDEVRLHWSTLRSLTTK